MYGSVGFEDNYFRSFGNSRAVSDWKDLAGEPLDFLIFWGGTDVNPRLYNQRNVYSDKHPDVVRDQIESNLFREARERGIPMLGICRGSQFLCVMSGGELYQDIGHDHLGNHMINTYDGRRFEVTSTHHQMMSPQRTEHSVLGWAKESHIYKKEGVVEKPKFDYEIVWFPRTKCLCVQGHPEYLPHDSEFSQYTDKLIKEYLLGQPKTGIPELQQPTLESKSIEQ